MKHIKTKEQARQYAIDYQDFASRCNLSYSEINCFRTRLEVLAEKYDLVEEFKENGII